MRGGWALWAVAAAISAALALPAAVLAVAGQGTVSLVSREGKRGPALSGVSRDATISPDGRFVAFYRHDGEESLLYLRDVRRGRTRVLAEMGDNSGNAAAFSGDDRYVAYAAPFPHSQSGTQVFRLDLRTRARTLISHWYRKDPPGAKSGKYAQGGAGASISANGRCVAFVSGGTNLVDERGPAFDARRHQPGEIFTTTSQVYVRDMKRQATVLASRASGRNGEVADGDASEAAISADGRYVAFVSAAPNLVHGGAEDAGPRSDVYVRDLRTGRTRVVSHGGPTGGRYGRNREPSISADGRYVAFLGLTGIVVKDLRTGGGYAIGGSEPVSSPELSANGRALVYLSGPTGGANEQKVLLRSLGGRTVFVHAGGNHSGPPSLSADGSRVAFDTYSYYEPGKGRSAESVPPDSGQVLRYAGSR